MNSKNFPYEHGQYIRIAEYSIEEVLPHVIFPRDVLELIKRGVKKRSPEYMSVTEHDFDGHKVKMTSQRYQLFATKGIKCVQCGLEGAFFGLERNKSDLNGNVKRYHFNLYGISNGYEVLLTKDHITPKSKGGSNTLGNYQVMCFPCNLIKGNK